VAADLIALRHHVRVVAWPFDEIIEQIRDLRRGQERARARITVLA
jgi:hypothetical protein